MSLFKPFNIPQVSPVMEQEKSSLSELYDALAESPVNDPAEWFPAYAQAMEKEHEAQGELCSSQGLTSA